MLFFFHHREIRWLLDSVDSPGIMRHEIQLRLLEIRWCTVIFQTGQAFMFKAKALLLSQDHVLIVKEESTRKLRMLETHDLQEQAKSFKVTEMCKPRDNSVRLHCFIFFRKVASVKQA